MGLFKCSKCNCIENTALGHYWGSDRSEGYDWDESNKEFKGKPLCSECAPKTYSDTHEPTGFGKWHGRFPKRNINEIPEKERSNIYNT
jgi:hypothetical protein